MNLKLLTIVLLATSQLFANPYVLGIRGNESATLSFAKNYGLSVAQDQTVEFDNANTFVRILEPIENRDAFIVLPEKLTANQLMEALIKVRTAKSYGAKSIIISPSVPLEKIELTDLKMSAKELGLSHLFSVSGANYTESSGKLVQLRPPTKKPLRRNLIWEDAYIANENHPGMAKSLAQGLNLPEVQSLSKVKGKSIYFVSGLSSQVNQTLFESINKLRRLRKNGNEVHLITPYLPYARSDKVDQYGTIVTARLLADLFESTGIEGITFARAHAPQSQGNFQIPAFQLSGHPTLNRYLRQKGIEVIISPDAGFQKDATKYADELGLPVAVINKVREGSKVTLKGISGPSVEGKRVAIIDDETASGSTLGKAAELLRSLGAIEVYGVVTHITGNGGAALQSPHLNEIVFTDTLPTSISGTKAVLLPFHEELIEHVKTLEIGRKSGRCVLPLQRVSEPNETILSNLNKGPNS